MPLFLGIIRQEILQVKLAFFPQARHRLVKKNGYLGEISLGLFNFGPKTLIVFYGLNVLHRSAADRYLVLGGVNVGQFILEGDFLKNLGAAVLVKLIGNGLGEAKFTRSPNRRSKEREKKKEKDKSSLFLKTS